MKLLILTRYTLIIALLFFSAVGIVSFFDYWGTTPLGRTPLPAAPHMLAWLGLLLFGFCGLMGAWGLFRLKSFGYSFGYLVVAGIFLMFLGEAYTHGKEVGSFSIKDIFWSLLFLLTPTLLLLGLRWVRRQHPS